MRLRRWFCTLPFRFRCFFRRSEIKQELRDELHDHLEGKTSELIAAGSAAYLPGSRGCVAARLAGPPRDGAMALEKKGEATLRASFQIERGVTRCLDALAKMGLHRPAETAFAL